MTMYAFPERLRVENPIDMGLQAGHRDGQTNAEGQGIQLASSSCKGPYYTVLRMYVRRERLRLEP